MAKPFVKTIYRAIFESRSTTLQKVAKAVRSFIDNHLWF